MRCSHPHAARARPSFSKWTTNHSVFFVTINNIISILLCLSDAAKLFERHEKENFSGKYCMENNWYLVRVKGKSFPLQPCLSAASSPPSALPAPLRKEKVLLSKRTHRCATQNAEAADISLRSRLTLPLLLLLGKDFVLSITS